MPTLRSITAGAVTVLAAALLLPAAPAAAATHCTAYGSLPKTVSLHSDHVVVHTVLRGTSGCHGAMTDNGASAYLYPPNGPAENMRWRHVGSSETIDLYVTLARTGKYAMRRGDVQLYDDNYRLISSTWRTTTMVVKHAGRIRYMAVHGASVSARVQAYGKYGWTAYAKPGVVVQRRLVGSSMWQRIGSTRPNAKGTVSYRTPTSSRYYYRFVSRSTPSTSGAHSHQLRG